MRIPYTQLLGGITPEQFLQEYWQKKPLLVRQAVPNFQGLLTPVELQELACREDAVSRLVELKKNKWNLESGPFSQKRWSKLSECWTLLVQNVNHFSPEAAELFYSFDFISHARLDDLQISLSPAQGGIGPHLDSYDVFLLQAQGRKHWQISTQPDPELIPDIPLKILANFQPEAEWVLEPGDMLYLPPAVAHCGTALEPGMTYSIGFRAPETQELATEFLSFLQDNLDVPGRYADGDLQPAKHPAELDDAMCKRVAEMLNAIRWDEKVVRDYLGCYLSDPKPHVFFEGPQRPMSATAFVKKMAEYGARLDLKTQLLFSGEHFYCNGDAFDANGEEARWLIQLADQRFLPPGLYSDILLGWLYEQYTLGVVEINRG